MHCVSLVVFTHVPTRDCRLQQASSGPVLLSGEKAVAMGDASPDGALESTAGFREPLASENHVYCLLAAYEFMHHIVVEAVEVVLRRTFPSVLETVCKYIFSNQFLACFLGQMPWNLALGDHLQHVTISPLDARVELVLTARIPEGVCQAR